MKPTQHAIAHICTCSLSPDVSAVACTAGSSMTDEARYVNAEISDFDECRECYKPEPVEPGMTCVGFCGTSKKHYACQVRGWCRAGSCPAMSASPFPPQMAVST